MELGKFQQIDLREYWAEEDTDFTPWLAETPNIELLSEAIGIDIEVEDQEVYIGSFKADILGRDSDNNKIIIENQLEKSNHSHLGQIITYASGVNASIIIWICKEITEEHEQAINWLNENTNENINFFAIKIELWKIDNSIPAPRFNVICKPNGWMKATRGRTESRPKKVSGIMSLQQEFLNYLKNYFKQQGTFLRIGKRRRDSDGDWYSISLGTAGITLVMWISSSVCDCCIYIEADGIKGKDIESKRANANKAFLELKKEQDIIEKEIGIALVWRRFCDEAPESEHYDTTTEDAEICIEQDWNIEDKDLWEAHAAWFKKYAELFYNAFSDRVKNLDL